MRGTNIEIYNLQSVRHTLVSTTGMIGVNTEVAVLRDEMTKALFNLLLNAWFRGKLPVFLPLLCNSCAKLEKLNTRGKSI